MCLWFQVTPAAARTRTFRVTELIVVPSLVHLAVIFAIFINLLLQWHYQTYWHLCPFLSLSAGTFLVSVMQLLIITSLCSNANLSTDFQFIECIKHKHELISVSVVILCGFSFTTLQYFDYKCLFILTMCIGDIYYIFLVTVFHWLTMLHNLPHSTRCAFLYENFMIVVSIFRVKSFFLDQIACTKWTVACTSLQTLLIAYI